MSRAPRGREWPGDRVTCQRVQGAPNPGVAPAQGASGIAVRGGAVDVPADRRPGSVASEQVDQHAWGVRRHGRQLHRRTLHERRGAGGPEASASAAGAGMRPSRWPGQRTAPPPSARSARATSAVPAEAPPRGLQLLPARSEAPQAAPVPPVGRRPRSPADSQRVRARGRQQRAEAPPRPPEWRLQWSRAPAPEGRQTWHGGHGRDGRRGGPRRLRETRRARREGPTLRRPPSFV